MRARRPRRIAIVLSSLKFGGAERVALNLAHALKAEGCEVEILLMSREGEFLEEAVREFAVVDLACRRTWQLPLRLARYHLRRRPDSLISSFWKLNLCACLARLVRPRCKLLLWEHSPPSRSRNSPTWLYGLTASVLYHLSTRVITVSTGVWQDMLRSTVGLSSTATVIFNPVPPPVILPRHTGTGESERTVLWVGRLDQPKNPQLMLEAFALVTRDLACVLQIVGDGRLRGELELLATRLQLNDRVRFLGFRKDVYRLMETADLLVLSSDREGLPTVLVEALYCGLPLVSTDCGEGIHDILQGTRYGSIVPVGDKHALASAIEQELRGTRDRASQQQGANRFRPEVIVKQFLAAMGKGDFAPADLPDRT